MFPLNQSIDPVICCIAISKMARNTRLGRLGPRCCAAWCLRQRPRRHALVALARQEDLFIMGIPWEFVAILWYKVVPPQLCLLVYDAINYRYIMIYLPYVLVGYLSEQFISTSLRPHHTWWWALGKSSAWEALIQVGELLYFTQNPVV